MELKSLAEAHPGWTFDAVDPSADMLSLEREVMGGLALRMRFTINSLKHENAGGSRRFHAMIG